MRTWFKVFIAGLVILLVLLIYFAATYPDRFLHIYFCNVGQGDAIYIRFPGNTDMLIDGGPNDSVLACLGRHMPFYDRTIDAVMMTHPQKDHMQGLIPVLARFRVNYFIAGAEGNPTQGYQTLISEVKERHVSVKNLYEGDTFAVGPASLNILWPSREYVSMNVPMTQCPSAGSGLSMKCNNLSDPVLGASTTMDLNDFSYYLYMRYGKFGALFTGDGDQQIQPEIIADEVLPDVDVLKFPHHGSKTAMLPKFLDLIKPELAVISVGKNSYGHPTQDALNLLKARNILVKRTDQLGDIEVITDGIKWWVKP